MAGRVPLSPALRERIHERDGGRCQLEGFLFECSKNLMIHHVVPLKHGGSNRESNLILLCKKHEQYIHEQADMEDSMAESYRFIREMKERSERVRAEGEAREAAKYGPIDTMEIEGKKKTRTNGKTKRRKQ